MSVSVKWRRAGTSDPGRRHGAGLDALLVSQAALNMNVDSFNASAGVLAGNRSDPAG